MKMEEFKEIKQTVLVCREQLTMIRQKLNAIAHKMHFEPVLKEPAINIDKATDNLQKVVDDLDPALRYIGWLDEFVSGLSGGD